MALEEEIMILRQDVEYINGVLAELVDDSLLTSEEGKMVKEAKRDVDSGDLSDFIPLVLKKFSESVILKEAIWTDSFSHETHFKSIEVRIEVYGDVNPRGDYECSVGLNGESYYIKKINY